MAAGIVCVHTCHPAARSFPARTTSTASGPSIHPVSEPRSGAYVVDLHGGNAPVVFYADPRSVSPDRIEQRWFHHVGPKEQGATHWFLERKGAEKQPEAAPEPAKPSEPDAAAKPAGKKP